jgi:hypothetical protein
VPTWLEGESRRAEKLEDAGQRARARANLAEAAARAGQRDVARELIEGARADCDLIVVPATSRAALSALARTVADAGDHAHALVLARTIEDPEASASVILAIARSLVKQGNPARARALVKVLRGGHRARGLASLALWAVEEGRHHRAAELLADAVEATGNLEEQRTREKVAAAVVKTAAAADDYDTVTEALGMIADPKRRDEALLAITRSHVKRGDYLGAEEDIGEIGNPADKVRGLMLFIRAGWGGEDENRQWAAEGARYVADIPDAAERVRVGASFAQALAEHEWRDDAASLIRREEPIAASLSGSARSDALGTVARAAMSADEPDLAASLVEAISDPARRTRAQRELLLTSTLADGITLGDPESGREADSVDRSRLLLAGATREKDFGLPDRRRLVAEALISVRWTTALGQLGHVDADALLAVADDFLDPTP